MTRSHAEQNPMTAMPPMECRHTDVPGTLAQLNDVRTEAQAALATLAPYSGASSDRARARMQWFYDASTDLEAALRQANNDPDTTDAQFRATIAEALGLWFDTMTLRDRIHAALQVKG